jgi:hypothetical protein
MWRNFAARTCDEIDAAHASWTAGRPARDTDFRQPPNAAGLTESTHGREQPRRGRPGATRCGKAAAFADVGSRASLPAPRL